METQTTESSPQAVVNSDVAPNHTHQDSLPQQAVVNSDVAADHSNQDSLPDLPNHCEIVSGRDFSKEEVIDILKAIAGTGKFWHDWDKLKYMLSFHLKQVLAEYPEATMPSEEQTLSLRETFPELVKRLDDALQSFIEGPPFTLQRLCEILLAAQSIYPRLVKLALALEKNLFVTSMLTKSTNEPAASPIEQETTTTTAPIEQETTTAAPPESANGETKCSPPSNAIPNGGETITGDQDEVMAEVEEAEVEDAMTIDTETIQGTVQSSSETNSTTAAAIVDS